MASRVREVCGKTLESAALDKERLNTRRASLFSQSETFTDCTWSQPAKSAVGRLTLRVSPPSPYPLSCSAVDLGS